MGFTLVKQDGPQARNVMSLIQTLLRSLRSAVSIETQTDLDERYLSDAVDHVDLERRIAVQSRAFMSMAPMNIGR